MENQDEFKNSENDRALQWLTTAGSMQAVQLENAMRNYEHPVYDPVDVGRHLMKALSLPMAGYGGDASKVNMLPLAVAVISYAITEGWDVVEEAGRPG